MHGVSCNLDRNARREDLGRIPERNESQGRRSTTRALGSTGIERRARTAYKNRPRA